MPNDDLGDRLTRWGHESTPDLDGAFANRLETDLRVQSLAPDPRRRFGALLFRPALVLGVAAVVVMGFLFVQMNDDEGAEVFLVAAEGTSVSIPGSPTTVDGVAGLDLPEGTQIRVGPNGSAIVAGVVLEAGTTAMIVDGQIELFDVPTDRVPTDRVPTDRPTTTTVPPTSDSVRNDRPPTSPSTSTAPTSTVTPATAPPATATPRTTIAPATTSSTSTTRPSTTVPSTPTTADPAPSTTVPTDRRVAVELSVEAVRNQQAVLAWRVSGSSDAIAAWEVRARRGDEVQRIVLIRESAARRLRVEIPARNVMYKVLARAADGTILAQSEWVGLG